MRPRSILLVAAAVCAIALIVFRTPLLLFSGRILVNSETPQRADGAIVLGGDYQGNRILKAAELARAGYVPIVIVSGSGSIYGRHEAEAAIAFAVAHGYDRRLFLPVYYPAFSTEDELRGDAPQLRSLGAKSILLVTSPSHTARATRTARQVLKDIAIHPVAAVDPYWQDGYWWRDREGRKEWLFEMLKSSGYFFHL